MQFSNPKTLQDAYKLLAAGDWKILSGGTDFYPALGEDAINFDVLDVTGIQEMKGIHRDDEGNWHIGALATWTDIIKHDLPAAFDGLKLSAREVGSIQIQNRATVVGNICNASPAADGVPPLMTLNAIVKIGSSEQERSVPLSEFILGNRSTTLKQNELVTGLFIPAASVSGKSTFLKLGSRKYLVISISMVAMRLHTDNADAISQAAICVGSCSAVAQRLKSLETDLIGKSIFDDLTSVIQNSHMDELDPIDDVRATGRYRLDATRELVGRTMNLTTDQLRRESS